MQRDQTCSHCGQEPQALTTCYITVSDDGYCEKEIASTIGMAKKVFQNKRKLFTGKMNLKLKKRIVKCLVWSVATYAAETWTLREVDRKKIEAFEMWIWRRSAGEIK